MVLLDIYDIEEIESCQQNVYKITTLDDGVYYYKKYINNQSWWTLENENICEREKDIHEFLYLKDIPVAIFKSSSIDSFVTKEVKYSVNSSTGVTNNIHYYIGNILKKIHSFGLIHGDFHHENILVDLREEKVKAIIDFEESIFYENKITHLPFHLQPDPMFDLATFYRSIKHFYPNNYKEGWIHFLKGYGLPFFMTEGIEIWGKRIDERNNYFRNWAKKNNIKSIII